MGAPGRMLSTARRRVVAVRLNEAELERLDGRVGELGARDRGAVLRELLNEPVPPASRIGLAAERSLAGRVRWLVDLLEQTTQLRPEVARACVDLHELLEGVEPTTPAESVPCPLTSCKARPGSRCSTHTGEPHTIRVEDAARQTSLFGPRPRGLGRQRAKAAP